MVITKLCLPNSLYLSISGSRSNIIAYYFTLVILCSESDLYPGMCTSLYKVYILAHHLYFVHNSNKYLPTLLLWKLRLVSQPSYRLGTRWN